MLIESLIQQNGWYKKGQKHLRMKIVEPLLPFVPKVIQYEIYFQDNRYNEYQCFTMLTCTDWSYIILQHCEGATSYTIETLPFDLRSPINYYEQFMDVWRQIENDKN